MPKLPENLNRKRHYRPPDGNHGHRHLYRGDTAKNSYVYSYQESGFHNEKRKLLSWIEEEYDSIKQFAVDPALLSKVIRQLTSTLERLKPRSFEDESDLESLSIDLALKLEDHIQSNFRILSFHGIDVSEKKSLSEKGSGNLGHLIEENQLNEFALEFLLQVLIKHNVSVQKIFLNILVEAHPAALTNFVHTLHATSNTDAKM